MATELRTGGSFRGPIENHSYDVTTQDSLNLLNSRKDSGTKVSADDMDQVIRNAGDLGQVTREEYMDLREWVTKNWESLSPEAKEKWHKMDAAMQKGGGAPDWHDGIVSAALGKSRHDVISSGGDLEALLKETSGGKDGVGAPAAGGSTSGAGGAEAGSNTSGVEPPANNASSGASTGASGTASASSEGIGDSWEAILAYIMDKISKKEGALKAKAKGLADQIDADNKAGGKNASSLNNQLLEVQAEMQKLTQMIEMVTKMSKQLHDNQMSITRNIGG